MTQQQKTAEITISEKTQKWIVDEAKNSGFKDPNIVLEAVKDKLAGRESAAPPAAQDLAAMIADAMIRRKADGVYLMSSDTIMHYRDEREKKGMSRYPSPLDAVPSKLKEEEKKEEIGQKLPFTPEYLFGWLNIDSNYMKRQLEKINKGENFTVTEIESLEEFMKKLTYLNQFVNAALFMLVNTESKKDNESIEDYFMRLINTYRGPQNITTNKQILAIYNNLEKMGFDNFTYDLPINDELLIAGRYMASRMKGVDPKQAALLLVAISVVEHFPGKDGVKSWMDYVNGKIRITINADELLNRYKLDPEKYDIMYGNRKLKPGEVLENIVADPQKQLYLVDKEGRIIGNWRNQLYLDKGAGKDGFETTNKELAARIKKNIEVNVGVRNYSIGIIQLTPPSMETEKRKGEEVIPWGKRFNITLEEVKKEKVVPSPAPIPEVEKKKVVPLVAPKVKAVEFEPIELYKDKIAGELTIRAETYPIWPETKKRLTDREKEKFDFTYIFISYFPITFKIGNKDVKAYAIVNPKLKALEPEGKDIVAVVYEDGSVYKVKDYKQDLLDPHVLRGVEIADKVNVYFDVDKEKGTISLPWTQMNKEILPYVQITSNNIVQFRDLFRYKSTGKTVQKVAVYPAYKEKPTR